MQRVLYCDPNYPEPNMESRNTAISELSLQILAVEQRAKEAMASTNRRGLTWWQVMSPALTGIVVGIFAYMAGQGAYVALASGIAVSALNLALVCVLEVRRMSKRLEAVIQLQASVDTSKTPRQ